MDCERMVAEINLNALSNNMEAIKKMAGGQKILSIVKADAYGHGVKGVSQTILDHGGDYLGVAFYDEGIQLRKYQIHAPIIILGYTPHGKMRDIIENNLIPTVYTVETAELISRIAVESGKVCPVHIKIDTGMGRLGFLPHEALGAVEAIHNMPGVTIEGIFTHYATSDEKDQSYTKMQQKLFYSVLDEIAARGIGIPFIHAANSGAILSLPDARCNMVRAGIIQYGLMPSSLFEGKEFQPVMSLKSQVSFVKVCKAGMRISYGSEYATYEGQKVATVPVGYADGYLRKMQHGGRVLIHGQYAPIVGRICMDQFMVDVTHIPGVHMGDEVILMGVQGENAVTAHEIAGIMDTIAYEVVCLVSRRVPRAFVKDGKIVQKDYYLY